MEPNEGYKRGFVQTMGAWYWQQPVTPNEEFLIALYDEEMNTTGEFAIRWVDLGKWGSAPRIEAFNDAWHVLPHFKDVLDKLAEPVHEGITPSDLRLLLLGCGLIDMTPRTKGL